MRIIGIDPSLTATGIAILDNNQFETITTIGSTGQRDATWQERNRRISTVSDAILTRIERLPIDIAVIEGPSYAQRSQTGEFDRHGLWWLLYNDLTQLAAHTVVVPPSTRAMYATGRGNAAKDVVMISAVRRYPAADITNNNEADAVILAAIGARLHGHPIDDPLPMANQTALTKLPRLTDAA